MTQLNDIRKGCLNMVNSRSISFGELCNSLLEVYKGITGGKSFKKLKADTGLTSKRLRLLEDIQAKNSLSLQTTKLEDIRVFLETLLDCEGIVSATHGKTDVPEIGDPNLLGRKRDRIGKLKEEDENQLDWYFSILVQGWAHSKEIGPLRDLRYDSRFEGCVCDYMVKVRNYEVELLECKRIHPGNTKHYSIEDVTKKIVEKVMETKGVKEQFDQTEETIREKVTCRHLLIDISAYENRPRLERLKTNTVKVFGYERKTIDKILMKLRDDLSGIVDKLTLCWKNLIVIEDIPRAIVQYPSDVMLHEGTNSVFGYEGWTVCGYPMKKTDFGELRVSSTVRALSWILTTYNMLSNPEDFIKVGPQERLPKDS